MRKDLSILASRFLDADILLACERDIVTFIDANRKELDEEAEQTIERLIDEEIKDKEKEIAELVEHKKQILKKMRGEE